MRFRDVRFRSKLLLLIGLFVIGFAAVYGFGAMTLARVQVTGKASAMYALELKANSDKIKLAIED